MTEYNDVPTANALYVERQKVESAISLIDSGGDMSNFTISQPPSPPGGGPLPSSIPPTQIYIPPPTPQEVADVVRAWLVQRQTDLDTQLAALGVTNPPLTRV